MAKIDAPVAQQVYGVGSGIASGLAGFIMATRLANFRGQISASTVFFATTISAVTTYLPSNIIVREIKKSREQQQNGGE